MIYIDEFLGPAIWLTPIPSILLVIEYVIFGYIFYLIGYNSVDFGFEPGFIEPVEELYKFAKTLSKVRGLTTIIQAVVGLRESYTILYDVKFLFHVDDLSEDVYIRLRVSDSNPDYGYLVGIVINGPTVEERTEVVKSRTVCPLIIEYSNDSSATVLVCRYDLEAERCGWSKITQKNMQKLAKTLIPRLRDLHPK
jgi:hypothetical protein